MQKGTDQFVPLSDAGTQAPKIYLSHFFPGHEGRGFHEG